MNQEANGSGDSRKWLILIAVSIANFSAALDMSIVTISFPRLADVFQTDASTVVWLAIAFSISELGLLLTLAKVGDTIGRKKVYVAGLAIYTVGLILCSISPNISVLILSRVVQGAGAAMTLTIGSAIVIAAFPRRQQGRAIGIFGMLMVSGLIAGPALGGVIIDFLDWQGIFWTRIPVGIISLVISMMVIREQKVAGAILKLDLGGATALLVGTSVLVLYLNLGADLGYLSAQALALLAAAVVILAAFLFIETRAAQPVLDLNFFRNRVFTMASVTNLIQMSAGAMGPILFPFFLINGLLYSSSLVGMLMAIIAVPSVILSPISGWLSDKIGNRIPMVAGTTFFSIGLYLASRLDNATTSLHVGLVMVLFGMGMGIFMAPNQSAVADSAPRENLATAMGVSNTMRLLGAAIGTALAGSLYAHQVTVNEGELAAQGVAPDLAGKLAAVESFRYVILLAALISILSVLTSFFTGKKK